MLEVEHDPFLRRICERELTVLYCDLKTCISLIYRFAYGKILGKSVPLLPTTIDPDVACLLRVSRLDICYDLTTIYSHKYRATRYFSEGLQAKLRAL